MKLLSGRQSDYIASKIASELGVPITKVETKVFSDGEFRPSIEETIRGEDVYIIQSTNPPAENLLELLMLIDAAKRSSANSITAIIPYFGYARQDRKDKPRVPISSKLITNLLSIAGANRVMTIDLHADQIQGFFEFPVDHLYSSTVFIPYIESFNFKDKLVIASPDMGGANRANSYAKFLNAGVSICYKQRKEANKIENMQMIGNVSGKHVIMVDDMVDTAGTIVKAAELMLDNGAIDVRAMATHALLSGNAYEKIENSKLKELIVTDTLPLNQKSEKIRVISIAELFSKIINKVNNHESISSVFLC